MAEFPQTVGNLTEASTNLYELVKAGNLTAYVDEALRLAIHRAVALETSRGWRIAKDKVSHKIDVVVALAQAALGAVKGGQYVPGVAPRVSGRGSVIEAEFPLARIDWDALHRDLFR